MEELLCCPRCRGETVEFLNGYGQWMCKIHECGWHCSIKPDSEIHKPKEVRE